MILDEIVEYKREFVRKCRSDVNLSEMKKKAEDAPPPRDFYAAVSSDQKPVNIIAEIKKASPSRGLIRPDFNPRKLAESYKNNGASAISVLTDEKFFSGSLEYLKQARETVSLPVLRKEFIIDEYQIYEARAAGADAILLIAAILKDEEMISFYNLARSLGMSVLPEAHDLSEVKRILRFYPRIIGVNNRDLKTFRVDLSQTLSMREHVPEEICLVSESGIKSKQDLRTLAEQGVKAALIGETFMRAEYPGQMLSSILDF